MVALGLISYKGMQPDRAIRSVEDQEPEIVELANAMYETASQEELSEREGARVPFRNHYTRLWPEYTRVWTPRVFDPPFWER